MLEFSIVKFSNVIKTCSALQSAFDNRYDFTWQDYFELSDCAGRTLRVDKRGAVDKQSFSHSAAFRYPVCKLD